MRRIGTWTAAAVLGAGLLTGCGGSDTEAYCDNLKDAQSAFGGDVDASSFGEMTDKIDDITDSAPDDVADDWEKLQGALDELQGALDDAGLSAADLEDPEKLAAISPEDQQKITEVASSMSSEDVTKASDNIEKHAKDECDIDLS